jgi:hypothetical protein
MALYGVRANNDVKDICHWCGFEVIPGQITVEVGIIGFSGHAYCWRLRRKGLEKPEIRERYKKYALKRRIPLER